MPDLKNDEMEQNRINSVLKSQPWYQQFLQQAGQDPNRVKLRDDQRKQLQMLASQHGITLPKGVQFDPSGNVNEQHGFAGQPGWLKAVEIAAAAGVGGLVAAPALAGMLGGGAAAGGGAGAGALGAGEAATTLGATGGLIPGLAGAGAVGAGGTGTAVGGSLVSRLMSKAGASGISDMAKAAGSYANAQAGNRGTMAQLAPIYDRTAIDAQTDRRAQESDAMKKLAQANFLKSGGGQDFSLPDMNFTDSRNGQTYNFKQPTTNYGMPGPSDAQKSAAGTLEDTMLKRLQPGGSVTPTPLDKYGKPGVGENIANYGALGGSVISGLSKFF